MQPSAIPPFCTVERFADLSGVSVDVVRGWVARGYLPTKKIGRYRLVDVVSMASHLQSDSGFGMSPAGAGTPPAAARRDGRRQATTPDRAADVPPLVNTGSRGRGSVVRRSGV